MKKLSAKTFSASIILLFLNMFFLEGCKKEMQINNSISANSTNASLTKSNIIYTDIIPDITKTATYSSHYYKLDLNNDDTADFEIEAYYEKYSMFAPANVGVDVVTLRKNRVACWDSTESPLAMNQDDTVSSNLYWIHSPFGADLRGAGFNRFSNTWGLSGEWTDSTDHYLGLKIKSGNNTYYGWVRLSVLVSLPPSLKSSVIIKDYAYNATPNKRILAGQMK